MTDTLDTVAADEGEIGQQQLAEQFLAQAKEQGIDLVGPNGLLNRLTKKVLETALEEEMAEHLGYDKHDPVGRNHRNSRKWGAHEDGADRDRAGRDRRPPRYRRLVSAADRRSCDSGG